MDTELTQYDEEELHSIVSRQLELSNSIAVYMLIREFDSSFSAKTSEEIYLGLTDIEDWSLLSDVITCCPTESMVYRALKALYSSSLLKYGAQFGRSYRYYLSSKGQVVANFICEQREALRQKP